LSCVGAAEGDGLAADHDGAYRADPPLHPHGLDTRTRRRPGRSRPRGGGPVA
jgi:hypothetical protein